MVVVFLWREELQMWRVQMMMEVVLLFSEVLRLMAIEVRYDYHRVNPVRHLRVMYVSAVHCFTLV